MRNKGLIVFVAVIALLGFFSVFTVNERERAIKFQLGRIIRSDYTPGLYFKIPFIQTVRKFDARIQNIDSEPELYLTSEKKNVKVDSFVKWKIDNVERYYKATGGNAHIASDRLSAVIQKRLKDEFGKRTIFEVVSGERAKIMDILRVSAKDHAADLGVELVDVRVKRIDLPEDVSSSVYQRMAAERKEVAKDFRSRGEEAAKVIRAKADREREVLLAEADRDAERTRGEGDALAANIYAKAYGQDAEFYSLYRSLNAYRDIFNDRSDVLLIQPDTEFFKYFNSPDAVK
jgi:membrane protease subunit HflC